MKFKYFLLNENKTFLASRIGDILNALQDLSDNYKNMGSRIVIRNAQAIVDQIRRILHTKWPDSEKNNLENLQACGVAIMKCIEEKDDLEMVLSACVDTLNKSVENMETPINNIASPE
jgi:hypothetical protein